MTTTVDTIQQDVPETTDDDSGIDSAADAFLAGWQDAEKPSKSGEGEQTDPEAGTASEPEDDENDDQPEEGAEDEQTEQDGDDDEDGEGDEGEDDGEEGEQPAAGDDVEVEVTVDGEARRVPIRDLKRLYGQEAALTRKSQEVATLRKKAETDGARHVAGLQKLMEKAQARFEPYSKIDFHIAAKEMSSEDFAALRTEAKAAFEDVKFLREELDGTMQEAEKARMEALRAEAQEAVKVLQDPTTGIPGWSQKVYNEVREFAVSQGLPQHQVDMIVNPAVIKIMHKAMLHDRTKAVATKKKVAAPRKVVKPDTRAKQSTPGTARKQSAQRQLQQDGSISSAADAFLAGWES